MPLGAGALGFVIYGASWHQSFAYSFLHNSSLIFLPEFALHCSIFCLLVFTWGNLQRRTNQLYLVNENDLKFLKNELKLSQECLQICAIILLICIACRKLVWH